MSPPREGARLGAVSPDEAAMTWLVMVDRGLRPTDQARLDAWLASSEANAAAWERAQKLWSSFDGPPDVLEDSMRTTALRARPPILVRHGLAAASAAAVVVCAVMIAWRLTTPVAVLQPTLAARKETPPDYVTAVGARSSVVLPDGSQAVLDTNSALTLAYSPGRRGIRLLRGQAFFTVEPDARRPFTVDAAGRSVLAIGTAFDVRLDAGRVSVVLARGHVDVRRAGDREIRLSPGEMFEVQPDGSARTVRVDLDRALAWRSGYLDFRDEPISRAVAEMNRYGEAPIVVGDASLATLRVSGRFRSGDPARFARSLAQIYPLRFAPRPDGGGELLPR